MFKKISLEEFNKRFQTEDQCWRYIFDLKWKNGFHCSRCGCNKSWKGRTKFNLRCRNCRYDESALANTVFHKLKIPLKKAFGIAFHFSLSKSGASSHELARIYNINQKSAWYFKRKLQQALRKRKDVKTKKSLKTKTFVIDSILISRRDPGANGLQQVHLTMQDFVKENKKYNEIIVDSTLANESIKISSELVKGHFKQYNPSINAWNFKVWLMGTHHHCSAKYLQGYVDEYWFRFTHRHRRTRAWHELMTLLTCNPQSYRRMQTKWIIEG